LFQVRRYGVRRFDDGGQMTAYALIPLALGVVLIASAIWRATR
jgi:hypothetical protein